MTKWPGQTQTLEHHKTHRTTRRNGHSEKNILLLFYIFYILDLLK